MVGTREYRSAVALDQVIALDAGDAIALAFLQNLEAPLMCAVEIARRLQADPFCELRMGIHSGVVFLRTDISGKRNVTGPGINLAERVMSCGGGGHILVSGKAADDLRHLSAWRGKLRYLGEYSAKDDWVQVWSYLDGVIGNAAPLRERRGSRRRVVNLAPRLGHRPPSSSRRKMFRCSIRACQSADGGQ